jgi:hypothetical protein
MLIVKDRFTGISEPEVKTYIDAVEAADGELIEFGVANAVNEFVRGCKNDNIWEAIKASCILAGARTLQGALVPLVGVAPTNNNFVSADYNRKTGLKGNGSTKYLNSNRANNADPRRNVHRVVAGNFFSTSQVFMSNNAFSWMYKFINGAYYADINNGGGNAGVSRGATTSNFVGSNRNGNTLSLRTSGGTTSVTSVSNFYSGGNVIIGQSGLGLSGLKDNMTFYSIGESLDLTKLDTRVTTLMNTFSSVIP